MKYNNIKSILYASALFLAGGVSLTSCTDWLDKDPESIIAEDEAFKNYRNFQGFIEEIYNMVPNITNANYCSGWNMGDDAVHNTEGFSHIDHQTDLGNYRTIWNDYKQCWINGDRCSLWNSAWKSIRKCNLGIQNIKSLVGTNDQRDILLGQMYFFRAWWHFELMSFFGGLPYIDEAFGAEIPELPRLTFQECADRCAQDFQKAYELLPLNWDSTLPGMETSGKNDIRVNKFTALCYLGKCYLWAGSPLMKETSQNPKNPQLLNASKTGKTYDYDEAYCAKAAEALGKALDLILHNSVPYRLAKFEYTSLYDHLNSEDGSSDDLVEYSFIWYTHKQNWKMPGSTEAIFTGVCPSTNTGPWNHLKLFGPKVYSIVDHDNIIHHPTANLIDQYMMSNGEPAFLVQNGQLVINPKSGYDDEYPYKNRDPRFYHDIVFDGFHYVTFLEGLTDQQKLCEYTSLYTGGLMRDPANGSSTGYFIQKLAPHQCNHGDGTLAGDWYEWAGAMQAYIPYMRVSDIYLMYAEARAAIAKTSSDLKAKPEYCKNLSAIDALNKLHQRFSSGDYPFDDVPSGYTDTKEHFLDYLRIDRGVELAFEGFRWNDLQRWLLLTEAPYNMKYSHEFERLQDDSWFVANDPAEAKVGNLRRVELIKRNLESKHYWFPLPTKDTYLYEGFPQNPGW